MASNRGEENTGGDGVFLGLTPKNQQRLQEILSFHLPEVITADRVIEQKTGYASEICRNMKGDVLAHLATLAERQHDLNEDQQASQLAKIEEHLRRAIVEHPEEVLRDRIVDVEDLWVEYQREAVPFRRNNELQEAPRHKELETLRHRIDALMEAARKTKPDETTWEQSLTAAAEMTEAADLASELADKLQQCIGKAQHLSDEKRREGDERRRWRIGIALSIVLTVIALVGGYLLGKSAGSETTAPRAAALHSTVTQHPAPQRTKPHH
jgi:glycine cleavage system H lipoate-binding protein